MGFSIKKLGNFSQFWKEEFKNLLYIAWIGFYGACMIILFNFKKTPDILDDMLPSDLPLDKDSFAKPYAVSDEDKKGMNMLTYFFSYKSDFPYVIKTKLEVLDGYFRFLGGMGSYLFSSHRYAIKSIINYVNVDNFFTDMFCFYLLPTAIFYLMLVPIIPIISFCIINFISSLTQPLIKNAFVYAYAFIFNLFDYDQIKAMMDISQFPGGIIKYLMNVLLGFLISFLIVPGVSILYSLSVWAYIIAFIKLMPLFLVYLGGISWGDLFEKILEQFRIHYIGLTIMFLYFSIKIAYKNLDQKVAWGTHIGIVILIIIILNLITTIKNIYLYLTGSITSIPNPMCNLQPPSKTKQSFLFDTSMKCK
jgi:hypothetical protein